MLYISLFIFLSFFSIHAMEMEQYLQKTEEIKVPTAQYQPKTLQEIAGFKIAKLLDKSQNSLQTLKEVDPGFSLMPLSSG